MYLDWFTESVVWVCVSVNSTRLKNKMIPQASVGRFSQLTLALSAGTDLFFECHGAAFSRL